MSTESNKTNLGHRRQASVGLGIITNNLDEASTKTTKNALFFDSGDVATPSPPPLLLPLKAQLQPKDESKMQHPRIAAALLRRARSYRTPASSDDDDDDQISALPSPLPPHDSTTSISTSQLRPSPLIRHELMPSVDPSATSAAPIETPEPVTPPAMVSSSTSIPIIAISPSMAHHSNVIPQLADHPMLGDMDDPFHHHPTPPSSTRQLNHQPSPISASSSSSSLHFDASHNSPSHAIDPEPYKAVAGMVREPSRPGTTQPLHGHHDEDLIGKQLGDFHVKRLLGVGAFSRVFLAERHSNDNTDRPHLFAIKTISKNGMLKDPRIVSSIEREVGVLKFIDHPNIIHIEATMETEHSLCIILEYARGIELFDFVQQIHASAEPVNEQLIRSIFCQLIHVVQWLHQHNIVHRDIKLENILIDFDAQGAPQLKLTDFGLARVIDPASPLLQTRCGSEEYAAPEIVQSKGYDGRLTDTWALGIVLYAMLVGHLPFSFDASRGERVTQLFYRIVRAQVKWPKQWDPTHLASARLVVEKILVRQPELRIRLDQIEQLDWFQ
ncbi:kinase-like domain-containing protein [Gongronella butleri]|nr:kinase-like domain-containing protein [Gongronella butleri]